MSRADYLRHMKTAEDALDRLDPPPPNANRDDVLLYAIAHLLAALAATEDPGGGLIEFREAPTT